MIFNHGTDNARGVAILIYSRLDYSVTPTRGDNERRLLNTSLNLDGHVLNIINVPQMDSTHKTFLSSMVKFISEGDDDIIGGDFHCTANGKLGENMI